MRPVVLAVPIVMLVALSTFASVSASPEHEDSTYGAVPGDPRVAVDAGDCMGLAADSVDTTCAVLYGHFFDLRNNVPSNTQRPPDDARDLARGFTAPVGHETHWDLNELTMWSTPGFVEYLESGERPVIHSEPGISRDVEIDTSIPMIGYWYLSGDYDEAFTVDSVPGVGPDVGVLPCLKVRMVLQTGRHYGDGDPLAEGSLTKTLVNAKAAGEGQNETLAKTPCPDGEEGEVVYPEEVTEFKIPLEPLAEPLVIPEEKGFLVFVEWYQFDPNDDPEEPGKIYQTQWNLHSGPDALGRVVLPIKSSLWIENVQAVDFGGLLYVKGEANSPWGSHDVDPGSIMMHVFDAEGEEIALSHVGEPTLRYSTDHDGHFRPVVAIFPWDYRAEGLGPGTYTIELRAKNWQHLGGAVEAIEVEIVERGGGQEITPRHEDPGSVESGESPVGLLPVMLGVLGMLVVAARRRGRDG